MKSLMLVLVLAASAFFATTGANAQVRASGTFCSAATVDGNWAFGWGYQDIWSTCNSVSNALQWRTRAPINGWNRGYFRVNGYNQVQVNCGFHRNFFQGQGQWPLQTAFNWANAVRAQGCLFDVR